MSEDAPIKSKLKRSAALPSYPNIDDLPLSIAEFSKNKQELIRGEFCVYNGKLLFQLRTWYRTKDGEIRPTRDGIAIQIHCVDDLFNMVSQAWSKAKSRGWLDKKSDAAE